MVKKQASNHENRPNMNRRERITIARVLNVEHVGYYNNAIDIYSKNKIGQYSKFLNTNPTFVTYYHRNMVQSRQDVGTGGIESELGPRSPIRFNKILNFPTYGIPQLNPQNVYDETGYDIELEVNDIVILPNTIKPCEGDYFIIKLPGTKEYLFRVNNFEYNTIQSNDFYRISADIKDIGTDLEAKRMRGQVVETFLTVFDNIGTEDRCFLRQTDIDYINSIADLYHKLRNFYTNAFYIRNLNSFTLQTGRYSETKRPIWRYDAFLERFINESNIYYEENTERALVLSPADKLQDDFNFQFDFTLYAAVLNRNIEFLRAYCYIVTKVITMPTSIYNIMHFFGESVNLFCYKKPINHSGSDSGKCPCCTVPVEPGSGEQWYDFGPLPKCTPTWDLSDGIEYFSHDFLEMILCGKLETDEYFELIIFNYLHNIKMTYDRKDIIDSLEKNERTFYYLPIIIYILGTVYKDYFVSENEIEV